ncbi:MAG: DJ-1/PfpI family protein [Streptosporangiaceae bacterium]
MVRTFARDVDDIRLTLHQNTELGLAAARRVAALVALSALTDAELGEFDAVFAPGGHGPMVDLAENPDVGRLLAALQARRAPIAALCHGPAMLLAAPERADGLWLFDGYRLTSFTDEEEDQTEPGLLGLAWLLDVALKNAGAVFDDGPRHDVDAAMAVTGSPMAVTIHPFVINDRGADVLRSVLADLLRAFPDLMISVSRVITTGDVVTALFKAEGTQAARFGLNGSWRNMATFGQLDELRHAAVTTFFGHEFVGKDAQYDWTQKAFHTNDWVTISLRNLFDAMMISSNVVDIAIELPLTFETGFTNLQFVALAADALASGDVNFANMISSIQTDEARHSQQGGPTLEILASSTWAHGDSRGSDPRGARPARRRRRLPRRLAVGAGLAAGRHHRKRPRAAARDRLHRLAP